MCVCVLNTYCNALLTSWLIFYFSLVADKIVFNSNFNKESLLAGIKKHLSIIPDYKPKNLKEQIEPKCSILSFPVDIPMEIQQLVNEKSNTVNEQLHIVWPHRWFVLFYPLKIT